MNTRKKMFIGGGLGLAGAIGVLLLFLPVVPVAFAGTATMTPSTPCQIPQPTQNNWFTLKDLSLGNLSFVYGSNVYNYGLPIPTNRTGIFTESFHVSNVTLTVDLQGAKIVKDNGSLGSFLGQEFVNKSLDSSFLVQGLTLQTTRFNATADNVSLFIAHVAIQIGPYFAEHQNGGPFTSPMSFSFDNFHLGLIYNCKTGHITYATSFQTSPASIASVAASFIRRSF